LQAELDGDRRLNDLAVPWGYKVDARSLRSRGPRQRRTNQNQRGKTKTSSFLAVVTSYSNQTLRDSAAPVTEEILHTRNPGRTRTSVSLYQDKNQYARADFVMAVMSKVSQMALVPPVRLCAGHNGKAQPFEPDSFSSASAT